MNVAIGPAAPVSENGGAVEAAGGRETAGTDNTLTARAGMLSCLVWPLGCRVAGNRYWTQPTDALDEVPASMLKEHGRTIRHRNAEMRRIAEEVW